MDRTSQTTLSLEGAQSGEQVRAEAPTEVPPPPSIGGAPSAPPVVVAPPALLQLSSEHGVDPSRETSDPDIWDVSEYPDDDHLPAPGELVSANLRMVRKIASGGMGSVWVAEHLTLKTEVAVKFLRRALAKHPVALTRFQREAEAAAKLRSPHVVQVFDHGCTEQGVPYIVMELLEGETLQQRWERKTCFTLAEMAEIVRQTGRALAKAHDLGIVHRDIKPENIFLVSGDADPFVKVLDFGIAKNIEDDGERVTSFGLVMGTPQFMSPEQMMGDDSVGPASDVWSLGVVAYALLSGRLPYEGSNLAKLAVEIDRGDPEPVSRYSAEASDAIDAWMQKSLCQLAAARYPDARTMCEALEEALVAPRTRTHDEAPLVGTPTRPTSSATMSFARSGTEYMIRESKPPKPRLKARWWAAPVAAVAVVVGYLVLVPAAPRGAAASPSDPAAKVGAGMTAPSNGSNATPHTPVTDADALRQASVHMTAASTPVVNATTKSPSAVSAPVTSAARNADPAKKTTTFKRRRDLGF